MNVAVGWITKEEAAKLPEGIPVLVHRPERQPNFNGYLEAHAYFRPDLVLHQSSNYELGDKTLYLDLRPLTKAAAPVIEYEHVKWIAWEKHAGQPRMTKQAHLLRRNNNVTICGRVIDDTSTIEYGQYEPLCAQCKKIADTRGVSY